MDVSKKMTVTKEVGIISYNDTVLKEVFVISLESKRSIQKKQVPSSIEQFMLSWLISVGGFYLLSIRYIFQMPIDLI